MLPHFIYLSHRNTNSDSPIHFNMVLGVKIMGPILHAQTFNKQDYFLSKKCPLGPSDARRIIGRHKNSK